MTIIIYILLLTSQIHMTIGHYADVHTHVCTRVCAHMHMSTRMPIRLSMHMHIHVSTPSLMPIFLFF